MWQVIGLVVGPALVASFASWHQRSEVGIAVIPAGMMLCFSVDAATQVETYGASLWPIVAAFVAVGTLAEVAFVDRLVTVAVSWRRREFH